MSIDKDAQELHSLFEAMLEGAALNDITLKKFQAFELELMNANSLSSLLEILLKESQADLGWDIVSLTLVDPEYEIQRYIELSETALLECPELSFLDNNQELEEIYHQKLFPVSATDAEAGHQLFFASVKNKPKSSWLLPLNRNHNLIGSYNIGKHSDIKPQENVATDFLQHLAAIISVSLEISINREHLKYLGLMDPLTGINNRRFFDQRLVEEVTSVIRAGVDISCLFIDIDHFKKINDDHGHQTGDIILKEVAQIIRDLVRSTDVVARYGGEEFIVLLSHKGKEKAIEIAERIRATIEKNIFTTAQHEEIAVTTSIGINSLDVNEHEGDVDDIATFFVDRADRALYVAKNNGRNRIEFFAGD